MAFDLYDYIDNYTIESIFYVLLIAFIVTLFEIFVFKTIITKEITSNIQNNIIKHCNKLPKPLLPNSSLTEQFITNIDRPFNKNPYIINKNNVEEIKKTLVENIDYNTKQHVVNYINKNINVNAKNIKESLKKYKEVETNTVSNNISILYIIYIVPLYILYSSFRERGYHFRMNSNAYLFIFSVIYLIAYQLYFRENVAKKQGVYKYGSIAKSILKKRLTELRRSGKL